MSTASTNVPEGRWRIGSVGDATEPRTVVEHEGALFDLESLLALGGGADRPGGGRTLLALLENWDAWRPVLARTAGAVAGAVPLDPVGLSWLPPVVFPRKLICVGTNYRDHLEEMGLDSGVKRPRPFAFIKPASTSLIGAGQPIVLPDIAEWIDWEVELALVIGRRVRHVRGRDAVDAVAGYCVVNDVSARDWIADQVPGVGMDWILHKGFDSFTPAGPLVTPAEFVADPGQLAMELAVNGVVKQDSSTSQMIFGVGEIVEHLASVMTLEPGDMIATGSPAGVGFGREPKEKLQAGDDVRARIAGLGELWSTVIS